MSESFPSIKPSSRSYRLGSYPTRVYRSLSGVTVKRSFGDRPTGYQLDLEFRNISDATVEQILSHYTTTNGGFERFTLPDALFAGMTSDLKAEVQAPTGIKWEYAGPPEVESVRSGLSSVQVSLIGEQEI